MSISIAEFEDLVKKKSFIERRVIQAKIVKIHTGTTGEMSYDACKVCKRGRVGSLHRSSFPEPGKCVYDAGIEKAWRFSVSLQDDSFSDKRTRYRVWQSGADFIPVPCSQFEAMPVEQRDLLIEQIEQGTWMLEVCLAGKISERTIVSARHPANWKECRTFDFSQLSESVEQVGEALRIRDQLLIEVVANLKVCSQKIEDIGRQAEAVAVDCIATKNTINGVLEQLSKLS